MPLHVQGENLSQAPQLLELGGEAPRRRRRDREDIVIVVSAERQGRIVAKTLRGEVGENREAGGEIGIARVGAERLAVIDDAP